MKRAFASVAGLVGLAALGRWLAKRRHPAAGTPTTVEPTVEAPPVDVVPAGVAPQADTAPADTAPADTGADPAEELRRKLADARGAEPDATAGSPEVEETLEERRARVHAKAREAIDSMGGDPAASGEASP